jgi:hypothetical protein
MTACEAVELLAVEVADTDNVELKVVVPVDLDIGVEAAIR